MHFSVPLAGLLAAFGIYGVIAGVTGIRQTGREATKSIQKRSEWLGVIFLSLFGFLGSAIGLAAQFGSAPWLPFLIATPVVGALGIAFFKMLEISPLPIFTVLLDTRHLGWRRRPGLLNRARLHIAEVAIDGDLASEQARVQENERSRAAFRGAMSMAGIITFLNLLWAGKIVATFELSWFFLAPLALLYLGLVFVLGNAGRSLAKRDSKIDWKRPFSHGL